ncbi:urease accessory protein UreD [Streptomyces sp. 1222.5]|uniref:urease accessory protein UreD n=1 Tax=Streptomyces sp. 1222.5 TaxID=1881026 RepID=UPI003EBD5536
MTASGVRATARIAARADGRGGTVLPVLEGEGPLAPRRTRASRAEARVVLVGAMSGPLGGDRFVVEADVGQGARLDVRSTAATIALPGQSVGEARYDVRLRVADGGELRWLPEPLISARGSDLVVTTEVEIATGARLILRNEQVLGRVGEEPGRLVSRLTVRIAGRTVLDQERPYHCGTLGDWTVPAGSAIPRSVGQLLVSGPELLKDSLPARALGKCMTLTSLPGPAVLVTAFADDALMLRRLLHQAFALIGWRPLEEDRF